MSNSDYTHFITNFRGRGTIVIQDLNRGRKSVTNDIDNVVDEICIKERIADPQNFIIVYKDSTSLWDIWNYSTELFIITSEQTWKDAARKYLELEQKV